MAVRKADFGCVKLVEQNKEKDSVFGELARKQKGFVGWLIPEQGTWLFVFGNRLWIPVKEDIEAEWVEKDGYQIGYEGKKLVALKIGNRVFITPEKAVK